MRDEFGATVRASDPAGMDRARALTPERRRCQGPYEWAEDADGLVVVTEWE
jgi:UDPglucose 6-dehydrogenase